MKDRGFKIVTIAALLIAVLGLSIGYATYTENLKISGIGYITDTDLITTCMSKKNTPYICLLLKIKYN